MARIHLVRHGQASFGADDYDQLTALGIRQAAVVGTANRDKLGGATIVSGTMRRHLQTAEGFVGSATVATDLGWNEFDYLDVIRAMRPDLGTPKALRSEFAKATDPNRAFQVLYDQAMERWATGDHDADYVESRGQFRTRVQMVLADLVASLPKDAVAFVFTSGGPISVIVQDLLGLTEGATRKIERVLLSASVTTLSVSPARSHLITLNEHQLLEAEDGALVTFR